MAQQDDLRYLERRLAQARALAAGADDISVRIVHRKMVQQYTVEIAAVRARRSALG